MDQLSLVGPQDKTEQSVLPGLHTQEVATDPAGPVGPDVTVDQVQPVAVGQYITCRPVGPDGMFSTCDSDQPMADGPVGRLITRSPVGSDGMLSTCDSDQSVGKLFILGPVGPDVTVYQIQPVAERPVGQYITRSPVGSDGMLSTCDSDRPVADGPVGQSYILEGCFPSVNRISQWLLAQWASRLQRARVGPCEMVSNCKRMDWIAYSPVSSTVIPDRNNRQSYSDILYGNSHGQRDRRAWVTLPFK